MTPVALCHPACGPLFQTHGTFTHCGFYSPPPPWRFLSPFRRRCVVPCKKQGTVAQGSFYQPQGRVARGSCYQPQGSQILASPMASATLHPIRVDPEDLGPMPGGLPSLLCGFPSRYWGLSVSKEPHHLGSSDPPPRQPALGVLPLEA